MVKRSIVKQGPTTLLISLPIKWVRKYDLNKGEELEVEERGKELIISTQNKQKSKIKEIKLLDSHYYYIWTEISAAYLSGFDEMKVYYNSVDDLKIIENDVLKAMMGFELIEHTSKWCILKKVVDERGEEFDIIMRRIFLGLIETSNEYLKLLKGESKGEFILPFERTNNRQTYYLRRLVAKGEYKLSDKNIFASTLVFLLEQLMNQYKYSFWDMEKKNFQKNNLEVIKLYEKIQFKLEMLYKLYFSYSKDLFHEFEIKTIRPDSRKSSMLDELKENPFVVHYLIEMEEKMRYASYQIHGINN